MPIQSNDVLRPFAPGAVWYKLASGATIPDCHCDDLREALSVYESYSNADIPPLDAFAHAIVAWRAARQRRAISDRAAERQRVTVSGGQR
jgi:hypothetical protein